MFIVLSRQESQGSIALHLTMAHIKYDQPSRGLECHCSTTVHLKICFEVIKCS